MLFFIKLCNFSKTDIPWVLPVSKLCSFTDWDSMMGYLAAWLQFCLVLFTIFYPNSMVLIRKYIENPSWAFKMQRDWISREFSFQDKTTGVEGILCVLQKGRRKTNPKLCGTQQNYVNRTCKNYWFRKNFNSRAEVRLMKSLTPRASSSMAENSISNTSRWSKCTRVQRPWCNVSREGKLHQHQHLTLPITPSVLCSPVLVTACELRIHVKKSSSKWNNYCQRLEILKFHTSL